MCDRSDLVIENVLLVHNFNQPKNENLALLHKLIAAYNTKVHLLQMLTSKSEKEIEIVKQNMQEFAKINSILNFECHVLHDKDVESGVVHFNQMHEMDIICIGTHGKGSMFHTSATEKLVNHLFKPIISFHLNN
jgi:nucleotide-binding universal stress UspA family protein